MIAHFKSEQHKFLSNFYRADVFFEGRAFLSSETAYMSAKSEDRAWKDFCSSCANPAECKFKSRRIKLVPAWDSMKLRVMYFVLLSKFGEESLRDMLINTGDENIQEGNWHGDRFWGVDLKSTPNVGENHLGRLLMRVRSELVHDFL